MEELIIKSLSELYVNPLTGEVNRGYIQHIYEKYGLCNYTESYIKKHYGVEVMMGRDVIEDWLLSHNVTLEKVLKKQELGNDKIRI